MRPKRRYGNPNGQPVDALRGVSAESMRAKRLAKKTPSGQQDKNRLVSYDPAHVRAAIKAQLCPFCGVGPFKNVALHTGQLHGIDGQELRALAGLAPDSSICDPRLRAVQKEHLLRYRTKISEEQAAQICKLYAEGAREVDLALKFGIGQTAVGRILHRSGSPVRNRNEHKRKLAAHLIPEIISLYEAGMLQREIGAQFGISQTRVGQILREERRGVPAPADGGTLAT